jgi:hypothetical protein
MSQERDGSAISLRLRYALLAVMTIAAGLAVHFIGRGTPTPAWRDVLGDALWAAMMFWWIGVAVPRARPAIRAVAALGVCGAVELSQLYHSAGVDALRRTVVGHLVLGSGFDPRDLFAYAAGVVVAALIDRRSGVEG